MTSSGYLDDLMPMPDAVAQPAGDSYVVQWRGRSFAPDEVLHFVLHPDLTYPWRGTGYRVQLRDVAAGLKQAAATKKGFMSEKWKPSIIVRVDGIAEEFAGKEGRRKFLDDYLSTDEAGEPWVVQADLMDVQQIKPLSLQDLAINDAVTLDKRTVASVMHVPAFLLGVGDYDQDAYNNYVRSTVMEIATAIQPYMPACHAVSESMSALAARRIASPRGSVRSWATALTSCTPTPRRSLPAA